MRLAFYYHIPIIVKNDGLYIPGYFGVFLDSLAMNVDTLVLFLHEGNNKDAVESVYRLNSKNLEFISLGSKTSAWKRALKPSKVLSIVKQHSDFDYLLVRSPSPLAPYFPKYVNDKKLIFMIVGDYGDGAANYAIKGFRDRIIQLFLYYNHWLFLKVIRKFPVMVNSDALYEKYKNETKQIFKIKTTTLSQLDFFDREDTCKGEIVQLLFTGRIDMAKGLSELIEALAQLVQKDIKVHLNIVGWELGGGNIVKNILISKARSLNIVEEITFHGFKSIGNELFDMYRNADIYVLPSYHEGFPRTIWEAMANSLPVITTKVGSIPTTLHHLENAYLIDPKNSTQLSEAISELINNTDLRKNLISKGLALAKENTLEVQSKNILNNIKKLMHEQI